MPWQIMVDHSSSRRSFWYLEGAIDESGEVCRVPMNRLPFRIGRDVQFELSLPTQAVSWHHAEVVRRGDLLMVRDLGSTNGTFLNEKPVTIEHPLQEGDLLHFATLSFTVGRSEADRTETIAGSTAVVDTSLPRLMAEKAARLQRLLAEEGVTHVLQPIVNLVDRSILGYEALGRGNFEGLPAGIKELFELAKVAEVEVDLSLLLRRHSAKECAKLAGDFIFFFNTHPAEIRSSCLIPSIQETRTAWPDLKIAVEVHESSVTEPQGFQHLRNELERLDALLVYDDFGAGQARLLEIADVPPDFLKFDRSLIQHIDRASPSRRSLVQGLVKMALELDIRLIAEGIETVAEANICRDLGFSFGQGYLFGDPEPAHEVAGELHPPRVDIS